jgi:hypothetical protein
VLLTWVCRVRWSCLRCTTRRMFSSNSMSRRITPLWGIKNWSDRSIIFSLSTITL